MDLAYHEQMPHVHRKDIADRQGVPFEYLDQILGKLRKSGLVESVRGRGGGYRLARSSSVISAWDILSAVEDSLRPVACIGEEHSCAFGVACVSKDAWQSVHSEIQKALQSMNLAVMVGTWAQKHHMCPAGGVRECKSG